MFNHDVGLLIPNAFQRIYNMGRVPEPKLPTMQEASLEFQNPHLPNIPNHLIQISTWVLIDPHQ